MKTLHSSRFNSIFLFLSVLLAIYFKFELENSNIYIAITSFLVWFVVYFLLVKTDVSKTIYPIVITGIILRLFFFGTLPEKLSDDVYRYVWDGKMQVENINPYAYAPTDTVLTEYRDEEVYRKINHADLPTIYPPVSQMIFYLSSSVGGLNTLYSLRIIYLLFDLLLLFFLLKMNVSNKAVIAYFLCPLVIVETYVGMHIDLVGVSLLFISLYYFQQHSWYRGVFLFVASVGIKYISIVLLPLLVVYFVRENRKIKTENVFTKVFKLLVFGLFVTALFAFPYVSKGVDIFSSFKYYSSNWEFNGSIYAFLFMLSEEYGRSIAMVLIALVSLIIPFLKITLLEKAGFILLIVLLLNHTLFPWYLLWVVPFYSISRNLSVMYLLAAVFLSYEILQGYFLGGIWQQNNWVRVVEFLPFFVLLLVEWKRGDFYKYVK